MVLGSKYVKSIQFVTPTYQYHMVEKNGYRRGGTIRDIEWFYQSEFLSEGVGKAWVSGLDRGCGTKSCIL